MDLVPERLRGEVATFEIKDASGGVLVEIGRRVTARHVRLLELSSRNRLDVPTRLSDWAGRRSRHRCQ